MRDQGHGPLAEWVREHVQALHAPPRRIEHLVTCGNTNGLDLALRCLLSRGDCVLTEEYTYAATLQASVSRVALLRHIRATVPRSLRSRTP